MDIKTLESFKLSDAIFFHDELNKNLWDENNQLHPKVKKQLLVIAKDFLEELGIKDLNVKDITISGSNAAYTYTTHSDLDLHILVDMAKLPNDEVYKELFTAKKTLYNDSHDITIHGVPVELYVQDSNEPVISLGEYSLSKDKWLRIPTKRRANLDQTITKQKYTKLLNLIKHAFKIKNLDKVNNIIKTIKRYRQAGLDKGGEFSPENLAYKILRTQGYIDKLYDLRDKLHSENLSIEEDNKLLDKPTLSPEQLARKHGVAKMHILKQLDMGIKVELEHTSGREVAREIALDHLGEDPNYYSKLKNLNLEENGCTVGENSKLNLTELGNVFYPFKVANRSDDLLIIESSKGELILYMTKPQEDTILIEFSVGGRYDVTGEGNALMIFSTVKKMLETELPNFIDANTKFITFSAEKVEPSRVKLYNRTVPVISKILGNSWKYEPKQNQNGSLVYYTWKREVPIEETISENDLLNEFAAYHGTFRPRLARFKPLSHFGTERAALERLSQVKKTNPKFKDIDKGYVYQLDLGIKNPGIVKDYPNLVDPGPAGMQKISAWSKDLLKDPRFANYVGTNPINNKSNVNGKDILKHFVGLGNSHYWFEWMSPTTFISLWIKFLRDVGIDGLIYTNQVEHNRSKSFIAFSPDDVKVIGRPKVIDLKNLDIKKTLKLKEDEETNLPSVDDAKRLLPKILAAAQRDYDSWDENNRDEYAGGGICHIIADSICGVLYDAGIECTPVSCSHEQHVYVAAKFDEGIYTIDIPYYIYEEGGGFSWKKLPDVKFDNRHVVFYKVTSDPGEWENYIGESVAEETSTEQSQMLSAWEKADQVERNKYAAFVKTKAGGDYVRGAKLYAKINNLPANDLFGDRARQQQFMNTKFNFDTFSESDWHNYWLLVQHCDLYRDFQKQALAIIKRYLGTDHSHYQYLYDRISCGLTGKQKYGTQPGCNKDKKGVMEGKVKLYTDPDYFGAEVDDKGFNQLPIVDISTKNLIGFEPDSKMKETKAKANVAKILAGLKKGDNIPPILVRKYKGGYQVLDGHHRFWAYKLLKRDTIPARIVPAKDIEEISKKGLAEDASGYIPSEKEKNDPRYKTALTVDIKPDTLKKNAQKLGSKISRAGIPPTLRANGKF